MASISQSIPSYTGGISEQADERKFPGQVVDSINAIPDATYGLYKRPGAKRIDTSLISEANGDFATRNVSTDEGILKDVHHDGSWFHYYRDETEGSYIGQVDHDGNLRVWRCSDGRQMNIVYGTGGATAIKSYLTPSSTANTEDLQFLTINDTTFVTNRSKPVLHSGTTATASDTHYAFVEILKTENGRQYALNAYSSESTTNITRATKLKIASDNLAEGGGTGTCPGIGTQVFSVDDGSKKNLIFRITTLGQQGQIGGYDDDVPSGAFACTYNRQVTLLHGGEGWSAGDPTTVTLTQAKQDFNYTVEVEKDETVAVKADIKAVRPAPTPFDADTAVTIDTVIGGITDALSGTAISCTVIGNGIYMTSGSAFQIEIMNKDLMRVMQSTVNDVSLLPNQCKDGYLVKVSNSQDSQDDDYYLRFEGENGKDGAGAWVEVAGPGLVAGFDKSTMPHVIQRTGTTEFTVKQFDYPDREAGDDATNPIPTFVSIRSGHPDYGGTNEDKYINKVLFFRNRLALLSGENVITCRPGTLGKPNFWARTALAIGASDPIDISSSSMFPSALYDGIEINAGLLVFSSNQQFLLSSDDTVLNPDTAKLRSVSTYNYNIDIPPISMGLSVGYVDNSGKYSRFNEMINTSREAEPAVGETSKLVPSLLPKDIDLITNSRENQIVLFGKTGSDIVYGFKYFQLGDKRQQASWFKWKLNNPIKYHFIIDDDYYFLDDDHFLQRMSIIQSDSDLSITQDNVNYLINLDNWTTVGNGSYSATTKLTTFANQTEWIDNVSTPNGDLVLISLDNDTKQIAKYAKCTVTNTDDFTVPGNWDWTEELPFSGAPDVNTEQITLTTHGLETGDPVRYVKGDTVVGGLTDGTTYYVIKVDSTNIKLATNATNANAGTAINLTHQGSGSHKVQKLLKNLYIGYLYEYNIQLPTIYSTKSDADRTVADVKSSLIIHRINLSFGKVGLYETTLVRSGKPDYTEVYESTPANQYKTSDAPYVAEVLKTVPVYEKNKNVDIFIKSSHPSPTTLHSMTWEGDYSPMHYQRV